MNVTKIVFSPTGGTQQVADMITSEWSVAASNVDLTDAKTDCTALRFEKDDIVVVAVPSFGGRVPALAAERLAKVNGGQARCVIVCVYGNRAYEDTLVELHDIAQQSGFHVAAAVAAVAEHSIMHQYATGRPDAHDKAELQSFGKTIWETLTSGTTACEAALLIPGNRPYKKSGNVGLVPKADETCVKCGLCAKNCPAQAISMDNVATADAKKCISCMRCVAKCPQSARKVNQAMVAMVALAIKKACSERKNCELYI